MAQAGGRNSLGRAGEAEVLKRWSPGSPSGARTHQRTPEATTRLRVTIENLRDSPLVESTIGLFPPGDVHPRSRQYNNFGGYLGGTEGAGRGPSPIAPHARRVIDVDLPDSQLQW